MVHSLSVYLRMLGGRNLYVTETRYAFKKTFAWPSKWECMAWARKSPATLLVESLSDSTIDMSYYTVAQLLHSEPYCILIS